MHIALYKVIHCAIQIAIHCAIRPWVYYTPCAINFNRGFWYWNSTSAMPCPIMFQGAKLLATSTSAVEWYKSCAHTSFLSKTIQILIYMYVPTQYSIRTCPYSYTAPHSSLSISQSAPNTPPAKAVTCHGKFTHAYQL